MLGAELKAMRKTLPLLLLLSLTAALPAKAGPTFVVFAQGARGYAYVPGTDVTVGANTFALHLTITQGSSLLFQNLDATEHTLTSGDSTTWYAEVQGDGRFGTDFVTRSDGPTPVTGVEALPAGTYFFFCKAHFNFGLVGVLDVV